MLIELRAPLSRPVRGSQVSTSHCCSTFIRPRPSSSTSSAHSSADGRSVCPPIVSPVFSVSAQADRAAVLPNHTTTAAMPSSTTPIRSTADSSTPACSMRAGDTPVDSRRVRPKALSGANSHSDRSSAKRVSSATAITTTVTHTICWARNIAKLR